jgi:hypothetical protein
MDERQWVPVAVVIESSPPTPCGGGGRYTPFALMAVYGDSSEIAANTRANAVLKLWKANANADFAPLLRHWDENQNFLLALRHEQTLLARELDIGLVLPGIAVFGAEFIAHLLGVWIDEGDPVQLLVRKRPPFFVHWAEPLGQGP